MKLYLVHCGYYDPAVGEGVYEQHTNFFVAAETHEQARVKAKALDAFRSRRMHVDGLQEINVVDGFAVQMTASAVREDIKTYNFRDLAPKPANPA